MSGWTAIVPMKAAGDRKTRLAGHLSPTNRDHLTQQLFHHVIRSLQDCPSITRLIILSDKATHLPKVEWMADEGAGLNAELERVRQTVDMPLLIIHADLALLAAADVEFMLDAAADGIAIAPDRHGTGTNAIAFGRRHPLALRFGVGSFALHHAQAPEAVIVAARAGLSLDIDTAGDLTEAMRLGFADSANHAAAAQQ
jgi:2-phospho-L-lactate/phosphoenolpyruvate guanylyltransferase